MIQVDLGFVCVAVKMRLLLRKFNVQLELKQPLASDVYSPFSDVCFFYS